MKVIKILVLEKLNFNEKYVIKKITGSKIDFFSDFKKKNFNHSIIFCRLKFNLNKSFLTKFKNLKYICSPTTGLNHIDVDYCKLNGIKIINLKTKNNIVKNITSTSEYTFALILSLIRNIPQSSKHLILKKNWDRDKFISKTFSEITIGIIGFGRIGKNLNKLLNFLKIKKLINDINTSKDNFSNSNQKIQILIFYSKNLISYLCILIIQNLIKILLILNF